MTNSTCPPRPVTLFYSYSSLDKELRQQLEKHLALLRNQGVIADWYDRQIEPGAEWEGQIHEHLNSAQLILLLVSADFLASDYCYKIELTRALERHAAGEARVIPVILRTCDWRNAPFARLQALPTDGKPIVTWPDRDAAFTDVVRGIRQAAADFQREGGAGAVASAAGSPYLGPVRIVPKGLRSFDAADATFFLELLPPPLDRGLPRCIRFWKDLIEQRDPEQTFCVGLLFGPSGCGKSSLVKAGLIPRLDDSVLAVYVEATANHTEQRLLKALRKRLPDLPEEDSLETVLPAVAQGAGSASRKVLLVLDQFEQWLHAHRADQDPALIRALRACDGARLQCLLLIRPEFMLAACRVSDQLGVLWQMGRNEALVDLFDPTHARHVLAEFGRAYGCLPEEAAQLSAAQAEFLDQTVAALADQDGRVVAVRLALFAEMVKGRPWTPQTLQDVGGAVGVGLSFLQENFTRPTAPYRRYEKAAIGVLRALLPEAGTEIRGHLRPETELRQATGQSEAEFAHLLQILVGELRLVTPVDPREVEVEDRPAPAAAETRFYQLTHDYLVPSIRSWLSLHLQQTWRGRARLRLEERTAQWTRFRERRFLPGPVEFISILAGIPWTRYKSEQRTLMRAASRWYGSLATVGLLVLVAAWWGVSESKGRAESPAIVRRLIDSPETTDTSEFLRILGDEAASHRRWVVPELAVVVAQQPKDEDTEVNRTRLGKRRADAAIALWQLGAAEEGSDALKVDKDPESLTQFVHRCKERGVRAAALWEQLTNAQDDTVRYGLLLALGEFSSQEIPKEHRTQWGNKLAEWYGTDRKSSIHSVCGWLLRQWGETDRVTAVDQTLVSSYDPQRQWFVKEVKYGDDANAKRDYFTFIVFPPGTFQMGSPDDETGRDDGERRHEVTLTYTFAMCDRELSNAQYSRFRAADAASRPREPAKDDQPAVSVSWNDAVEYCQWLTGRDPKLKPCYVPVQKTSGSAEPKAAADVAAEATPRLSFELAKDWQFRDGFRLPTEAEWEYACRAETVTRFSCGSDDVWLKSYVRFSADSSLRCGELRPNLRGLFDIHGNVWEWCWDGYEAYAADAATDPTGGNEATARVYRGGGLAFVARGCRSAYRSFWLAPAVRYGDLGFRVAAVPPGGPSP